MSAPTTIRSGAYVTGACRIGEHGECHGNQDIKAGGSIALKLRCACNCHTKQPR